MRGFILVTCLVVSALARPEAGGYNYNGLQRGLPQNAHQLKAFVHQQLPVEQSFSNFAVPPTSYLAPSSGPAAVQNFNSFQQLDGPVAPVENLAQPREAQPLSGHHEDSYNMAYQHTSNSHESGGYPYAPQTTVHKHIYVHVPPKDFEEEDIITPRVHHQAATKQKHYKIVFIKAPAAPSVRPPVVPPPPQNEEKTLIYVLHKRPELEQDIIIPTAAPTKPSKPEVFFIKYKTKKEEAPVYGPPPQQQQQQGNNIEPRNVEGPSMEYGTPAVNDFAPESNGDLAAPLTTVQPVEQGQQQQQQFAPEIPSETYGAPTMTSLIMPEEVQPTLAAPSNQYLAPENSQTMAPIIVEDTHVPATNYGPPNRFFLTKKK